MHRHRNASSINGTVDFGYLAITPGEAKSKLDTPKIRLYAIRETSLAQKKGIAPIGEEEFLSLVWKIMKSIKHAPGDQFETR